MKRLFALAFSVFLSLSFAPVALAADKPVTQADASALYQAININTADVDTLAQLKGIGAKKAQAIVAWREANGEFTTVEQLLEIKGIGASILDANRARLTI